MSFLPRQKRLVITRAYELDSENRQGLGRLFSRQTCFVPALSWYNPRMATEKREIAVELRLTMDEAAELDVLMADRGIVRRAALLRVLLREEWKRYSARENVMNDGGK